jgi:hypothetical protein
MIFGELDNGQEGSNMPECECGCGKMTKGGIFAPGHDQKLRSELEKKVGGLLHLRDLVNMAEAYCKSEKDFDAFKRTVNRIFKNPPKLDSP